MTDVDGCYKCRHVHDPKQSCFDARQERIALMADQLRAFLAAIEKCSHGTPRSLCLEHKPGADVLPAYTTQGGESRGAPLLTPPAPHDPTSHLTEGAQ